MKLFYLGGSNVNCMEAIYSRYLSTTKAYFSTLNAVGGVYRWGLCSSVDSDIQYLKECFSIFIEVCVKYDIIDRGFATPNLKFSELEQQPRSLAAAIDAYRDKLLDNAYDDLIETNVRAVIRSAINDMADSFINANMDFGDMMGFLTMDCDDATNTKLRVMVDAINSVEFSPVGYLSFDVSFVDSVTQDK